MDLENYHQRLYWLPSNTIKPLRLPNTVTWHILFVNECWYIGRDVWKTEIFRQLKLALFFQYLLWFIISIQSGRSKIFYHGYALWWMTPLDSIPLQYVVHEFMKNNSVWIKELTVYVEKIQHVNKGNNSEWRKRNSQNVTHGTSRWSLAVHATSMFAWISAGQMCPFTGSFEPGTLYASHQCISILLDMNLTH